MPESKIPASTPDSKINPVDGKSPAFQFYPRDFMADANVQAMTMEQRGIYLWLLCHAWLDGGIPNNTVRLAKMCQVTRIKFASIWPDIGVCFQEDGDRLVNPRMERERHSQTQRRHSQRINAAMRWQSHGNANAGNAMAMPRECSASASASAVLPPSPPEALKAERLTVEDVFGPSEGEPDAAAEYVGEVVDAWKAEFAACRNGATFPVHPIRDYPSFKELAEAYPDLAHLRQMFRFFFLADDLPDWAKTRSPKSFLKLAPETDAAVRASR